MTVEVRDGKIYLGLTEENIRNMCRDMPDFKERFLKEMPNGLQIEEKQYKEPNYNYGGKTNDLLSYVGMGKTRKEIISFYHNEHLLNNCVQHGYLYRQKSSYYIVSDLGYKKLKEFRLMDRKSACAMIVKCIRGYDGRVSSPEIAEIIGMGKNRCRDCLVDIRKYIDDGILIGYKYKNLYECGVKSFFVYWYEG